MGAKGRKVALGKKDFFRGAAVGGAQKSRRRRGSLVRGISPSTVRKRRPREGGRGPSRGRKRRRAVALTRLRRGGDDLQKQAAEE